MDHQFWISIKKLSKSFTIQNWEAEFLIDLNWKQSLSYIYI